MIRVDPPCYPNGPLYAVSDQQVISSSSLDANPTSFLYNLSLLRDKVNHVQSLAPIFLSPDHGQHAEPTATAMGTLIQEIIVTASSMMFAFQQMSLSSPTTAAVAQVAQPGGVQAVEERVPSGFFSSHQETVDHWYNLSSNNFNASDDHNYINQNTGVDDSTQGVCKNEGSPAPALLSPTKYDIVELDAADILAKYTHYCHVCGKGFKRDANLRMHMRAHGEEYKSSAALSNPKKKSTHDMGRERRKYSCPHEGCRWNKNHAKFQPLKSMICVKNHYKRSHCPKMYVCKRCNRKQFSVLSDLRTHEKHCGNVKWICSCGTTFSRKDKLMGHVALFVGHAPAQISKQVNF